MRCENLSDILIIVELDLCWATVNELNALFGKFNVTNFAMFTWFSLCV